MPPIAPLVPQLGLSASCSASCAEGATSAYAWLAWIAAWLLLVILGILAYRGLTRDISGDE